MNCGAIWRDWLGSASRSMQSSRLDLNAWNRRRALVRMQWCGCRRRCLPRPISKSPSPIPIPARWRPADASDRGEEWLDTDDVHHAREIVGEYVNMANQAKAALQAERLEAFADRGYFKGEEILACEEAAHHARLSGKPSPISTRKRLFHVALAALRRGPNALPARVSPASVLACSSALPCPISSDAGRGGGFALFPGRFYPVRRVRHERSIGLRCTCERTPRGHQLASRLWMSRTLVRPFQPADEVR
jgi:hypothetical protein